MEALLEEVLVRHTVEGGGSAALRRALSAFRGHERGGLADALAALVRSGDALPLLRAGLALLDPLLQSADKGLNWVDKLEATIGTFKARDEEVAGDLGLGYFLVAVASLLIFAGANVCGPPAAPHVAENPSGTARRRRTRTSTRRRRRRARRSGCCRS